MDYVKMREISSDYARYVRQADGRAINPLKEYYTLGLESPSVARLFLSDAGRNSRKYLEEQFKEDILCLGFKEATAKFQQGIMNSLNFANSFDQLDEIKPLLDNYAKRFKELYPYTSGVRMKLVDAGRVTLGEVLPKMETLKKMIHWRGSVPKEFSQVLKKVVK